MVYRLIIINLIFLNSFSDYCDESKRTIYHQSAGNADKVLTTNNDPEIKDSSWGKKGAYFVMDMGCTHTFEYILIKNSHNADYRDASSKTIK